MNDIAINQNRPEFLKLLRARSRAFQMATRLKAASAFIVLVIPAVGIVIGYFYPQFSPYIASIAILSVLDAAFIRRNISKYITEATLISEEFDTSLFKLEWNDFLAKRRLDAERIHQLSVKWSDRNHSLQSWYIGDFSNLEMEKARLICQRTNLYYDARLRKCYSKWVIGCAVIILIALLIIALCLDSSLIVFITGFLVPSVPYVLWCISEYQDHTDIADYNVHLKESIDVVFDNLKNDKLSKEELTFYSRQIQDSVFIRRIKNPVILPLFYRLMRNSLEDEATVGVNKITSKVA